MCMQQKPHQFSDNIGTPLCLVPLRYHTDPSGTYTKYAAKAIGSGAEGAQSTLQVGLTG